VRQSKRDDLQKYLESKNVGTLIHYPVPPHLSEAYNDFGRKTGDFPVAEAIADTILSLPISPHIEEEQIDYVQNTIKSFFNGQS